MRVFLQDVGTHHVAETGVPAPKNRWMQILLQRALRSVRVLCKSLEKKASSRISIGFEARVVTSPFLHANALQGSCRDISAGAGSLVVKKPLSAAHIVMHKSFCRHCPNLSFLDVGHCLDLCNLLEWSSQRASNLAEMPLRLDMSANGNQAVNWWSQSWHILG